MDDFIGREINNLALSIRRDINSFDVCGINGETISPIGIVLVYIYDQHGMVYQKDIEKHFGITRSAASKTISTFEAKGLLVRKNTSTDARLKTLSLTNDGYLLASKFKASIASYNDYLVSDLSEEEIETFKMILAKIKKKTGGKCV